MNNFKDLKVGDKVLMGGDYTYAKPNIRVITRIGATFIEVTNSKYCNINGHLKGVKDTGWGSSEYIRRKATEEDIVMLEKYNIISSIKRLIYDKTKSILDNIDLDTLTEFNNKIIESIEKTYKKEN
jgi:hypothetical protein